MDRFARRILQSVVTVICRCILFVLAQRYRVTGLENLQGISHERGVIFAANHTKQIDPGILTIALPLWSPFSPMYYVSLENKYYNEANFPLGHYFYGGALFRMFGAYPIRKGMHDYAKSFPYHEQFLREGKNVCIFPEGRRIPGSEVGEARGGVAYLADVTGATVVPVAITGIEHVSFKSLLGGDLTITVHFQKPTTYAQLVKTLDPIYQSKNDIAVHYKKVAEKLLAEIATTLHTAHAPRA